MSCTTGTKDIVCTFTVSISCVGYCVLAQQLCPVALACYRASAHACAPLTTVKAAIAAGMSDCVETLNWLCALYFDRITFFLLTFYHEQL